jgi:hypothetical protein
MYDENWVLNNEQLIQAAYAEANQPYSGNNISVWGSRIMSQAASGVMTKQQAQWSGVNSLRSQLNLTQLPKPQWIGEEVGTLRPEGLILLNDGTPNGTVAKQLYGYRMLDAFAMHLYGIQHFNVSLDYPLSLGFNVVVVALSLAQQNGHIADLNPKLNPNLYMVLDEVNNICKTRGVRLWTYVNCDMQVIGFTANEMIQHWMNSSEVISGGFHIPSVTNEGSNNGVSMDLHFPAPANCPVWSRGSEGEKPPPPQLNNGTIVEIEIKRRNQNEEKFKMNADAASIEYSTTEPSGPKFNKPMIICEPTFAAENNNYGRRSADPKFFKQMAGCAISSLDYGCAGLFFGSDASATAQTPGPNQHACAQAMIQTSRRN